MSDFTVQEVSAAQLSVNRSKLNANLSIEQVLHTVGAAEVDGLEDSLKEGESEGAGEMDGKMAIGSKPL